MKRNPKDCRRRAKALTDPHPEFVSLVTAGANMTPIKIMKSDGLDQENQPEAEEVEVAIKAADHEVLGFRFDKTNFAEETVVKSWLDDGGYTDYEITSKDDFFEVGDFPADREIKEVKIKGVSVFIATKTTEDAARAESQGGAVTMVTPVKKKTDEAPVEAVKEDVAAEGGDNGLVETVDAEKTEDAVEVEKTETDEPADATGEPVLLAEDRAKSLYHVGELASLVTYTRWLCSDLAYEVVYGEEEEQAARASALQTLKDAGQSLLTALAALFGAEVADVEEAFRAAKAESETPADETVAEAEAEKGATDPFEETPAVEAAEETAAPAEVIEAEKQEEPAEQQEEAPADPMAEVREIMKNAFSAIEQLTNTVADLKSVKSSEVETLVERVSAIETERQTRKGADVEEVEADRNKVEKKSDITDLRTRSVLGMRNPNSL